VLDAVISDKLDLIHVTCKKSDDPMMSHLVIKTQKLEDYNKQIHRYVCFVITAQLWYVFSLSVHFLKKFFRHFSRQDFTHLDNYLSIIYADNFLQAFVQTIFGAIF